MKKLIINADDFGLTEGVCRGIHELLEMGAIRDTTAMVAVPGAVKRAVAFGARTMRGVLGLHLQLTSGAPVSELADVPSLVTVDGIFRSKAELVDADLADIRLEWRKQVDVFVTEFGFLPTHLDSHHSVHDVAWLGEVYLELAVELGVPVRRGRVNAVAEQRARYGVHGTDAVVLGWTGKGLGVDALKEQILEVGRGQEVVEVVVHPGYSDVGLRAISSLNDMREMDLAGVRALHEEGWAEANGFEVVRYKDAFGS